VVICNSKSFMSVLTSAVENITLVASRNITWLI
jgi:hypothetical protein